MKNSIYTSSIKGKLLFVGLVLFASSVIVFTLIGLVIYNL